MTSKRRVNKKSDKHNDKKSSSSSAITSATALAILRRRQLKRASMKHSRKNPAPKRSPSAVNDLTPGVVFRFSYDPFLIDVSSTLLRKSSYDENGNYSSTVYSENETSAPNSNSLITESLS
ncbi:hypothetical protein H8356DRAFT_1722919 [Neocallimastix lanati (nom. inval.)]|nr:hypothetical protein H8356DRAFT_1722919 [Neocallimastix sp. JGI-2020a]